MTLDALWDELLLDACASDGPIRDNDVRQAIAHYRAKVEAEVRRNTVERLLHELYGDHRGIEPDDDAEGDYLCGCEAPHHHVERTARSIIEEGSGAS